MNKSYRLTLIYIGIVISFLGIAFIFWREEIRYALPTPVPENYKVIDINSSIALDKFVKADYQKPILLHFFNPDCPCSRFNITHFEDLLEEYEGKLNFYAVLQTENKENAIRSFEQKYKLNIPVILDKQELLAKYCGVYATPQAVLLDKTSKLYYRGNYNRSRYCTDPNSNYAQMAIDSILSHKPAPNFGRLATKSYGCELPSEDTSWF